MTPSELKSHVEQRPGGSHFFDRATMRTFGDTMRNYGVRRTTIATCTEIGVAVYELYRKRPVNHGLRTSAYFDCTTFARRSPTQGEN